MRKIKRILIVAGSLAAIVAILFGVIKWTSNEKTTVSSFKFKIGDLSSATGEYSESSTAIYTEDLIECEGLSIVPDFESKCTYRVFWYNLDGKFISATEETTKYTEEFSGEAPLATEYCRIVIYPHPTDENGKTLRNFDIKFYEVVKYANQLTIKVNKKQIEPIDYYAEAVTYNEDMGDLISAIKSHKSISITNSTFSTVSVSVEFTSIIQMYNNTINEEIFVLNVKDIKQLKIDATDVSFTDEAYLFLDESAYCIKTENTYLNFLKSKSNSEFIVDIPTDVCYIAFRLINDSSIAVYGYQPR